MENKQEHNVLYENDNVSVIVVDKELFKKSNIKSVDFGFWEDDNSSKELVFNINVKMKDGKFWEYELREILDLVKLNCEGKGEPKISEMGLGLLIKF